MLRIVPNYPCIQFQGKCMIQTQEIGGEPHFGPDLGPLGSNSDCQNFSIKLIVRHCSNLSFHAVYRKNSKPNLRKEQKTNFESNFSPFGPNLDHQIFFLKNLALSITRYHGQLSLCAISKKT